MKTLSSWSILTAQMMIIKLDLNQVTLKEAKILCNNSDFMFYKKELLAAGTKKAFIKILCNALKEA